MGVGGGNNSARSAACCGRCSNCKPCTETIVRGELPCGADLHASIPSDGHIKVRVTASHRFHVALHNGVELTISKNGIRPLIEYLERVQKSL